MDNFQDTELLTEFVAESLQGLGNVEKDLMSLESDGGEDKALVNRIFRAVHSIKGTGSYMGLDNLVKLSHLAETLLDQIRSGERQATSEVTDAILAAVDDLVGMLNASDVGKSYDCQSSMAKLNGILGLSPVSTPAPHTSQQSESLSSEPPSSNPASSTNKLGGLDESDPELLAEFVVEGIQGLSDIESDLLSLETDGSTDAELVNRIFRAVHTIKGNATFLKLHNLVSVAHKAESLLDRVRAGTESATAVVTDAVLAAVDALKGMLQTSDIGASFDCQAPLAKLDAALNGKAEPAPGQLSEDDVQKIQKGASKKDPVFRITFDLEAIRQAIDVKEGVVVGFKSLGKILHSSIPTEQIDSSTSGSCTIYLETVLAADMLSDHFSLKPENVCKIDPTALKATGNPAPIPTSIQPGTPSITSQKSTEKGLASEPKITNEAPQKASLTKDNKASSTPATPSKAEHKPSSEKQSVDQSMRVPVHILNKLLEWTGTMVMARNQLMNEFDFRGNAAFRTLSQSISGVHETVIETRMQTTGSLFERYRRIVRDLSRQLGKEVALHIEGGDLELDRTILESFADPLTHLIRNSLDHALETPAEREAAGKNRQGNIFLRSYVHSGEIILAVEDDGRGISAERVCEKAVSKGVITQDQANQLTEHQKVMLIFQPGFSTKDQATDVSGRGVGMDVVRNNIEAVGGSIDVVTKVGSGTTFNAILPLAKALVSSSLTKALIIEIDEEQFAVPETAISEIIQYDEKAIANIVQVDGESVYQLRDQLVALLDLRGALGLTSQFQRDKQSCLVILQYRKHQFGAIVDRVFGIQEIIVRETPKLLANCGVFSGHTVLGTGHVSLILDIHGLVNKLSLKFVDQKSQKGVRSLTADPAATTKVTKNLPKQKMVVFSYSDHEFFAIPLELVAIIERISLDSLRKVGNKEYCQIKNETISIMRLDSFLPITPFDSANQDCCLIRPAAVSFPIGILTGPNITVIEVDDNFESRLDDNQGIVGTFLHNENLVMLLDVFSVFEKHAPDKIKKQDEKTRNAKILVAEDSLFFRKLINQYISRDEWTVEIVEDGVEAWEKLCAEPNRYDLVISDINMPRMDGFQLATKIREDKRFDMLPLVALTTLSDDHFREKGLSLGFDRYVIKIDKNHVRSTVAECLQIRRNPSKS
ncbi:MAG: Hpt domain-containing protein [Pirellula sp.]|jgi:two-component system chemotaxis sensor kinase CheA|nr:Hpt domain-containing protein [Pirellula sp.]